MRPDEHKKKKNAAYKKKHGIKSDMAGDPSSSSRQKGKDGKDKSGSFKADEKSSSRKALANQPSQNDSSSKGKERHLTSSSSSESEDTEKKEKPKKSFSRRQIVSNWKKYELDPAQEEKVTSRGESYEKLLALTGETLSHFRFKDELEWEVQSSTGSHTTGDGDGQFSQFLSVNPSQLTQALACLPMHQQLGIPEDVFPTDQITTMKHLADEEKVKFVSNGVEAKEVFSPHNTHAVTNLDGEDPLSDLPSSSADSCEHYKHDYSLSSVLISKTDKLPSPRSNSLTSPPSVPSHEGKQSHIHAEDVDNKESVVKVSDKVETISPSVITVEIPKSTTNQISLEDDDLDSLLNMDTPVSSALSGVSTTNSLTASATTAATSSVAGTTTAKIQGSSHSLSQSTNSITGKEDAPKKVQTADLEDWLDSILDD